MPKQLMYLDETPVVALVTLLGSFCDDQTRYFKFGINHWALFKALQKHDSHLTSIGHRISMDFPKNQAPRELVKEIQTFLLPGKMSNERVRELLTKNIGNHVYRSKYSLVNQTQLRREFERFQGGLVKYINSKSKKTGIRMVLTRPNKK